MKLRPAIIACVTSIWFGGCTEASRTQQFDVVISPHREYTLIAAVIEPWFPQGPYYVSLSLQQGNAAPQLLVKTELAYDGVPFTKTNIGVRWTGDREAFACLRATDRPDKAVQIIVEGDHTVRTTLRTGC